MQVAELFVNLGIKGADKTINALTGVYKGLDTSAKMATETKLAILGAMYALERMFVTSGEAAAGMMQFEKRTGITLKTLQQYQYAARQVNVSNEDMKGTFESLQQKVAAHSLGGARIEGMARLGQATGNISPEDLKTWMAHPEALIERLHQYVLKTKDAIGIRNQTLASFGLSQQMQAALEERDPKKYAFRQEQLNRAPVLSNKTLEGANRSQVAVSNLEAKVQRAMTVFTAKHGEHLVKGFDQITTSVIELAEALDLIATKMKLFEASSEFISFFAKNIGGLARWFGSEHKVADIGEHLQDLGAQQDKSMWNNHKVEDDLKARLAAKSAAQAGRDANPPSKDFNMTVHQHGIKDMKDGAHHLKNAVKQGVLQIPAINFGG